MVSLVLGFHALFDESDSHGLRPEGKRFGVLDGLGPLFAVEARGLADRLSWKTGPLLHVAGRYAWAAGFWVRRVL